MSAKAVSLRYMLQKFQCGVQEAISTSSSSLTVALTRGLEAYRRVRRRRCNSDLLPSCKFSSMQS
jgi:hypothetical protein